MSFTIECLALFALGAAIGAIVFTLLLPAAQSQQDGTTIKAH